MATDKPTTITSLGDLHLDARNPNRGTARGREALAQALRDHGAGRSILVDHAGRVVAGNKVAAEAAALQLPVTVVRTSGERLVIVQRTDLDLATDPKARQLALADNRVAELNLAWDDTLLREFANEGLSFDPLWTDEELEQLFGEGLGQGQTDADAAIEPGATNIVPGDLFALGDHRLLCGDATVAADVARVLDGAMPALMVTDPPYGVTYDPAWRAAAQPQARTAVGRVANDERVDWFDAYALFPGATAYLWHAGIHTEAVAASLRRCEFVIRSQIIWVKQHFVLSRGHYHHQHEPCWYAVRTGRSATWCGSRTQSTVWQVPNLNPHGGQREGENAVTGHSTQKPVRLFEVPLLNHTRRGEAVYDPFCGSGTALIAAEKTRRRCLAIELDPRYVQAAITRWEAYAETMPIFNVDVTADPHHPRVIGPDHAPVPAINDFLSYLEQCARSPYTVRAYARGLAHFAGWLHEAGVDLDAVTRPLVGQYIGAFGRGSRRDGSVINGPPANEGRQARTVNHRLSVLASYF